MVPLTATSSLLGAGNDPSRPEVLVYLPNGKGSMPGHNAQMPIHYDLHVWVHERNPNGVFAPWNPAISCP